MKQPAQRLYHCTVCTATVPLHNDCTTAQSAQRLYHCTACTTVPLHSDCTTAQSAQRLYHCAVYTATVPLHSLHSDCTTAQRLYHCTVCTATVPLHSLHIDCTTAQSAGRISIMRLHLDFSQHWWNKSVNVPKTQSRVRFRFTERSYISWRRYLVTIWPWLSALWTCRWMITLFRMTL